MSADFINRVWDAFWEEEGNNQDGLERVIAVVFAEAAQIARDKIEDAPDGGNDNGATRDGWEMACKAIAERLAKVEYTL